MNTEHANNTLINALRKLIFRVSELELYRRRNLSRNRAGADMITDISNPLSAQIDKLAAESKKTKGVTARTLKERYTALNSHKQLNKNKFHQAHVQTDLEGLALHYKESAARHESTTYLGEKLKSSTWSHLQTALMRARMGETGIAKIHADIANQSLKEAAHYMSKEDYKVLADDVTKSLTELKL